MSFHLGDRVRDKVSGIEGIAVCVTTWLNGCERWSITPQGVEGTELSDLCCDVQQIELVKTDPIGLRRVASHRNPKKMQNVVAVVGARERWDWATGYDPR